MPAPNVIQLRQLLKEKMPDLRLGFEELAAERLSRWPTGLPQLDEPLAGGLPRGALTEIISRQPGTGSALLIHTLLRQAAREGQIVTLVDGADSLDVTQLEPSVLSRLLWVRCRSTDEALKSADLLLRDQNLPLLLLDLAANPVTQLRKIPATTWFRFQRIVEPTSTVAIILTPQRMVGPAQMRLTLAPVRWSVKAFEREPDALLHELNLTVSDVRRTRQSDEQLRTAG